ncbi:hypothetical protein H7X65_00370, partial [Candidatus Parcubacteria bacterium]|nr:hypothetical protein [Candidatus Parcubacteria bacterium]
AFESVMGPALKFERAGGSNWWWKLMHAAAVGSTRGTPVVVTSEYKGAKHIALGLAKARIAEGRFLIPTYAFDGRHASHDKITDARFSGTEVGMENMFQCAISPYGNFMGNHFLQELCAFVGFVLLKKSNKGVYGCYCKKNDAIYFFT